MQPALMPSYKQAAMDPKISAADKTQNKEKINLYFIYSELPKMEYDKSC